MIINYMPDKPKQSHPDFEKSFQRLEQLVQEFEHGNLDLEVGLEKFKEALKLAEVCKKRLDEVENKVTKIKQEFSDFNGASKIRA